MRIQFGSPSQALQKTSAPKNADRTGVPLVNSVSDLRKAQTAEQSKAAATNVVSDWVSMSLKLIWQGLMGSSKS